jgi:transcriptional regulator with XRE-family HTH domain
MIGNNIKVLRELKGISQEELAKSVGVHKSAVSKWEKGIYSPKLEIIPKIADFFGVSIDELFSHEPTSTVDLQEVLTALKRHQVYWGQKRLDNSDQDFLSNMIESYLETKKAEA